MNEIVEDLNVAKARQRQVKDLLSLLLEYATLNKETDPRQQKRIGSLIKNFKLDSDLERSTEYLETLKREEDDVKRLYSVLLKHREDQDNIVNMYLMMADVQVSILSRDPDEATNIEICKYLVDFQASQKQNTTKDDQAVGEQSPFSHKIKFQNREYDLEHKQEYKMFQKTISDRYYSE